jgi:menaquinone-dependent protoporphyrinogen oxidase
MSVLVAYASRHGATRGIAERIVDRLVKRGLDAEALPVKGVRDLDRYDAFVVGSALYMFHWLGEGSSFVRQNQNRLAARPVWLFSSGPLGADKTDAEGKDVREAAGPKELAELKAATHARDHRVFFGAYDPQAKPVGLMERMTRLLPAAREAFPSGDFRDWPAIEAFADVIADELRTPIAARP